MLKTRNLNLILFYLLVVGLFLSHTVISYGLIIPVYIFFIIKIFMIDKKISFEHFFVIIISLFLINILFQFAVNFSPKTIFYSVIILLSIIVYSNLSLLDLNIKYLSYGAMFLIVAFLLHPSIIDRSLPFQSYFKNPNSLAGAYFFLFFIIELTGTKRIRILNGVLFLPVYVISITSRALLLGFIVYYTALFLSKFRLRNIFVVFAVVVLALFMVFYIFPENKALISLLEFFNLNNTTVFGSNILYGAHREELWRVAVLENPSSAFGIGFGNSNEFIQNMLDRNLSPHNTFINLYLEGGFLLVITYIFATVMFYIYSKTAITKSFIIAVNVRMFFESGFPFGISLQSAMLFLPYFIDKLVYYAKKNDISYSESDNPIS